ncbi:MAG TPA: cyclohexanecarboxyl-CoA dehydrogenase [Sneathiellales bacterium]|nr:cyclohexanecarboxyl-CoA dehydrogenase [Sneathiellales bacterium]
MDFAFTDEQLAIKETAERFAREKLAPDYQKREADGQLDRALVREMGELGLIAPDMAEEHGGPGLDCVTAGMLTEAIAYGDFGFSYVQLVASLMGHVLSDHANPDLTQEWVPKMVSGEKIVGIVLTEPRGGSDVANLVLKAEKSGNGYVLNGEKASMSFSTQADGMVVFARTGSIEDEGRGVSAFFVDLNEKGISRTAYNDLGTKIVGRGSVFFDDVHIPADCLLGEEGEGFRQIMHGFDYSRAMIDFQCLGATQASLDDAWTYSTEREAMGRPIAQYQGVTFPLAEAETYLTAARLLCYKTLWLRDHNQPHTSEAAMCKWWLPKTCVDVLHNCILTHGHMGYSMDMPHQQRMRDVMGLEIGDGTAQIMKLIIAREKIGRVAVQYG